MISQQKMMTFFLTLSMCAAFTPTRQSVNHDFTHLTHFTPTRQSVNHDFHNELMNDVNSKEN